MSDDYGVGLYLFYGEELFKFLGMEKVWPEILKYLELWKKEVPELPETNFDLNAESSFEDIKDLNPTYYRKIFSNDKIFNEIILTLFPEKETLKLLLNYFKTKSKERRIYQTLFNVLKNKI